MSLAVTRGQRTALQPAADDHLLNVGDQRNRVLVLIKCRGRTPHKLSVLDLARASQLDQRSCAPDANALRPSHIHSSRSTDDTITALDHHRATHHRQAVRESGTTRAADFQQCVLLSKPCQIPDLHVRRAASCCSCRRSGNGDIICRLQVDLEPLCHHAMCANIKLLNNPRVDRVTVDKDVCCLG